MSRQWSPVHGHSLKKCGLSGKRIGLHKRFCGAQRRTVKIQLLITKGSEPCSRAEAVWRSACAERGVELLVVDVQGPEGAALCEGLSLSALPALMLDGRLMAVGVQSPEEARALLDGHC